MFIKGMIAVRGGRVPHPQGVEKGLFCGTYARVYLLQLGCEGIT